MQHSKKQSAGRSRPTQLPLKCDRWWRSAKHAPSSHKRDTREGARPHTDSGTGSASIGQTPRTRGNEDSMESNRGPTSTDRSVTNTLKKLDIQTMPSKLNHRSSGSLEGVQTFAIYKPGKGRKSGGNQKSTRGSHDTQKQTFLRTTRDTRPSSPEDGSEHKPVRQLERREPRCRQEH